MKKINGALGWLVIGVLVAVTPAAMAADWIGYNGHSYKLTSAENLGWDEAQAEAEAAGGYLTTINDAAENAWINSTFSAVGDLHIGANDKAVEGEWRWVEDDTQFWQGAASGSAVDDLYNNWASGEPNNAGAGQDLGKMYVNGTWDDDDDAELSGVIESDVLTLNVSGPGGGWVVEGDRFVFYVRVTGGAGIETYVWKKDGTPLAEPDPPHMLVIDEAAPEDEGEYTCIVQEGATIVEKKVYLDVVAPGTLPASGMLGLGLLAGAFAIGGACILLRRQRRR